MSEEFEPAIAALEKRLADMERKANEIRRTINLLCEEGGKPPRYPDGPTEGPGRGVTEIKDDTFYGKRQQTAIREYLEMRKVQNLGPAKPRDIFEALKAGGYQFETKDDNVALVSLRALLRKRTNMFHKLPTGSYGLAAWYPDVKSGNKSATHSTDDNDDSDDDVSESEENQLEDSDAIDEPSV